MPVSKEVIDEQLQSVPRTQEFFTKKEIAFLPEVIAEGEVIKAIHSGTYEGNTWLIVVTTRRLLFLDKGMFYGLKQVELPLSQISGITYKVGLLLGKIMISTSGGNQVIDNLQKLEVTPLANLISDLVEGTRQASRAVAPAIQAAPAADDDVVSRLERLAALKERGILTDMEFLDQKQKILASM